MFAKNCLLNADSCATGGWSHKLRPLPHGSRLRECQRYKGEKGVVYNGWYWEWRWEGDGGDGWRSGMMIICGRRRHHLYKDEREMGSLKAIRKSPCGEDNKSAAAAGTAAILP